jgi:hypothetical protein
MVGLCRGEPFWQRLISSEFKRIVVHAATLCGNEMADKPDQAAA